MFATFAEYRGIEGTVGARVLSYSGRGFWSPVYTDCEWKAGEIKTAACGSGCREVPDEYHHGCGIHALWQLEDAKDYTSNFGSWLYPNDTVLVLIEGLGRVVLHEYGLRAERARVVAAIDWRPRHPKSEGLAETAAAYFDVPLVDQALAQVIILGQRDQHAGGLEGFGRNPPVTFRK